jgi:acyl carrier protein
MLHTSTLGNPPANNAPPPDAAAPDAAPANAAVEIRRYIVDTFLLGSDGGLTDGQSLMDTGVVDSTGMMAVVAFVEDHFGITVLDEEMVPDVFDTIERMAAYVERKRAS